MPNQVQSILRKITRKAGEPLNILTFCGDERYDTSLAATGHNFYSLTSAGLSSWRTQRGPIPPNYTILQSTNNQMILPPYVIDLDMIIVQDKTTQYQLGNKMAQTLRIPMVLIDHDMPDPTWPKSKILPIKELKGVVNILMSEHQKKAWGYTTDDYIVNLIGLDSKIFVPSDIPRNKHILWLGDNAAENELKTGYTLLKHISGFPMPVIPVKVFGANPGLSQPAPSLEMLIRAYQTSSVFLNTSIVSAMPKTVAEAMLCGCPVVSVDTGEVSKIITHEKDGFISKNSEELRGYCQRLLEDEELAMKIGMAGRETAKRIFGMTRFVETWQGIFDKIIGMDVI